MVKYFLPLVFILTLWGANSRQMFAQYGNDRLVQLSGIVMAADSLYPIPYTSIWDKTIRRGTISNLQGFFSFVVHKGDTVLFSAVGYDKAKLVVPADLIENTYSVIQFMRNDTILLPTAVIYPWPTPYEFKQAFLALDIPDDDITRAKKNLDEDRIQQLAYTMKMDGAENFDYQMRRYSQNLYSAGQTQHMRIFDVFAWAEFFKALKRGDFKKKYKNDDD